MVDSRLVARPLRGLARRVQDWSVASQQQARRNAMVATTACAQRRIERQDVDDYLDARAVPTVPAIPAAPEEPTRPTAGRASHA
ncbi:hypothetical protein [Nocardioides plantarum]|uniref:Uncharacterized protein n=1 Tax=Nocardioides plantarum TaxID=29299 RepID=A0ABV5K8L7_9ACTN|nr:hypothetical protein [Nocardioides plantarum]